LTEPPGDGVLSIDFRHPTSAIRAVYETTSPVLLVDGERVETSGWEPHRMPLPAGEHRVQVSVTVGRYEGFGAAERAVTIVDGAEVGLVYLAPRVPASPGAIRGVDEKQTVEVSWLMVGCLVVVLVAAVALTVVSLL